MNATTGGGKVHGAGATGGGGHRRGSGMSKTSSVLSAKSIITDLDTVGVSGKKIEDTMKLSHVMDLVRLFQVRPICNFFNTKVFF